MDNPGGGGEINILYRILMLTDGGLQEMGILSVGHRVELTVGEGAPGGEIAASVYQ